MAKRKTKSTKKKAMGKKSAKRSAKKLVKKTKAKTRKVTKKKVSPKKKTEKVQKVEIAETKPVENFVVTTTLSNNSGKEQSLKERAQERPSYSKEELQHFKQILLKKREEVVEMLEAHKQSLIESTMQNDRPVGAPYSIHMEYGTETEEREKMMFFIAREEKMLNYIDAALARIERGTYGVCISCGKLIDKRRLEAVPHTQLCLACKTKQKKGF